MKTLILLSLAACGAPTKDFSLTATANEYNTKAVISAASDINSHLGYTLVSVTKSDKTYTAKDKLKGDNFIAFDSEPSIKTDMEAIRKKLNNPNMLAVTDLAYNSACVIDCKPVSDFSDIELVDPTTTWNVNDFCDPDSWRLNAETNNAYCSDDSGERNLANLMHRVIIHEMGHALGLVHVANPGEIMFADVSSAPISEQDWANYVKQLSSVQINKKGK